MNLIRAKTAYYPAFHLGDKPRAVECELRIVEANGKRYLQTPFAFLDAFADDDIERSIDGRGYYATAADCESYLAQEYPWHAQAEPIMEALLAARHREGDLVGPAQVARKCDVNSDQIHLFARGHKRFNLKAIRAAVRLLAEPVLA